MITANKPYHLIKSGGLPDRSRLSRWKAQAYDVIRKSDKLQTLSDARLLEQARAIRWRAKSGIPLSQLMPEAFALVRESARRTLGMMHYPVQIMGGIALFEGHVAEMQTGEGKTLTATLPTFLRALQGKGVHVITVNDYLAGRDAETMGKIYRQLGLTTGVILTEMETDERRSNYGLDITYGTAKEMGFDFLRDRLRTGAVTDEEDGELPRRLPAGTEAPVQRGHHFALIDEADSILIDEARTPLIIGLTQPNDPATVNLFRWSNRASTHLKPDEHFVYEPDKRSAYLTDDGCRHILLMAKPSLLNTVDTERIYTQVEKALTARFGFRLNRDYVVVEDKIVIVDESTGRLMDGRKWQDGLHQAVEAKELVPITAATGQAARITVQSFFRRYQYLAGMTGTATPARREFWKTYRLNVSVIPTNLPCIRKGFGHRIFVDQEHKRNGIVSEIEKLHTTGRAILIGTPSVAASEALGQMLTERGIQHRILNARFHEEEAQIVAEAGKSSRITIATNMAGRGTDILLDDEVRKNGGLHVIATEMHSSARIDRQLVGRAARQGDPGSFQFFLSLEDELLYCLPDGKVENYRQGARPRTDGQLGSSWLKLFRKTQRFLERNHRKQRKTLLKQEKYRSEAYRKMGLDPYLELTEN